MLALLIAVSTVLPDPPKGRFVLDQANILTQQEYQQLEGLAENLDRSGDGQLGILVTNDLFGRADRKELAVDLFKAWGIGHKKSQGRDDGILILAKVTQPTRGVKVEVGYDMEGRLNDGKVGEMVRQALPLFKDGKWGAGLIQLSSQIVTEMHAEGAVARVGQKPKKSESYWYIWAIAAGVLVIGGLAAVLILMARRRRLQAEIEAARVRETRARRDREQEAAQQRRATFKQVQKQLQDETEAARARQAQDSGPVILPGPPRREVPFVEYRHYDPLPPAVVIPIETPVERHYPRSEPSRSKDDDDSTKIVASSSWSEPSPSPSPDPAPDPDPPANSGFDEGSSGGGGTDTDV